MSATFSHDDRRWIGAGILTADRVLLVSGNRRSSNVRAVRVEQRWHPPLRARGSDLVVCAGVWTCTEVVILEDSDRALHTASHVRPCWCDGLEDETFFAELYDRCLKDAGFGYVSSEPKGMTITRAVRHGSVGELERLIRDCM